MRKVDAFAHILPPRYLARLDKHLESAIPSSELSYYREGVFRFDPSISDLDARWRNMDEFGDYAQILVLAVPPLEDVGRAEVAAEFARLANDEMAELVGKHRDRFIGFVAALPLNDLDASLLETERAVVTLGALGVQVFTSAQDLEPLYARIEELGRAVWLHPTSKKDLDYGLWWSLGWPFETAAALSRLVYSGLMERHPSLKVIAHHGAGMVPHFSARLGMGPGYRQVKDALPRPPLEYFRRFHADTALFGAPHAVRCVIDFFGPSHVLFGTDVPLGPPDAVRATISDIDGCGLDEDALATIYSGNALRLLGNGN